MPKDEIIEKHTHLIITLSDGNQIRYIDVRRFGRFWLLKDGESDLISGQSKLGVEPTDLNLTAEYLKTKISSKKKTVKEILLDQSIVAGIGNIYADEILYAAKIYPGAKCNTLDDEDYKILASKIKEIILWGIETNKMTSDEYLSGKGKEYRNMPY